MKQQIHDAVWNREIDQITTREVTDRFGCSLSTARKILMAIVTGTSGDDRFKYIPDRQGVKIKDGSLFTYSPMDISGGGISTNMPKHYIWFAS